MNEPATFAIPARYRKMENMHIVFWLFKDVSWCMNWRALGIAMILPTLAVACVIAFRTRHIKSELAHNLAIIFWITANSYWMIAEFFAFDEVQVWGWMEGRHLALIPFAIGISILLYYYAFLKWKEKNTAQVATL